MILSSRIASHASLPAALEEKPAFVFVNETKLNKTTSDEQLTLTGYQLLSRRDRRDGRQNLAFNGLERPSIRLG